MGCCAVLATRHGASPPGPPWPSPVLYHRASLSGLFRASAEAQDNSHTSVSGHKGEGKASFLPLSQSFCSAKQCSFQNEVASILLDIDNKSQHPYEPAPGFLSETLQL